MNSNILIIGGTYFLGKAFTELMLSESDAQITLLHRGSGNASADISAGGTSTGGRIREILADRHDAGGLKTLFSNERYDAIVDFCAYQKGDIETLLKNINATADRYIFISTTDVYRRGTGQLQGEDAELEERDFGGEAGAYIKGKVALEKEIGPACEKKGCRYTILRPVFIYGPGNYAPRESIYFQWIDRAGQIIHPVDADGEFQLVYVKDVARAIKIVCESEKACNKAYNVCENRMYTYESFAELLKESTENPFTKAEVDVNTVNEKGIPLSFPLTEAETNRYDGSEILKLGMQFTDPVLAMRETYDQWRITQ